jgi:hypothetical protein
MGEAQQGAVLGQRKQRLLEEVLHELRRFVQIVPEQFGDEQLHRGRNLVVIRRLLLLLLVLEELKERRRINCIFG